MRVGCTALVWKVLLAGVVEVAAGALVTVPQAQTPLSYQHPDSPVHHRWLFARPSLFIWR